MIYSSRDIEQNILKLVILGHFLPFYHSPPNDPENQNFEEKKWKKCLEILSFYTYMCTINEDMIYGSWNIRCNKQKFLSFWTILDLLAPDYSENQNIKIEKDT